MANPTTNYSFQMPTSSDLVTDLPADFETFGQAVDTRLKALQPGTTLGDLAYSSATANTNTRLAVGSTGQVLTVSGGVPTWATPAGGGGKVLQVVSATTSTTTSTTSTTFGDTNLTATITPSATTSKILIMMTVPETYKSGGSASNSIKMRMSRGGTSIYQFAQSNFYNAANADFFGTVSATYLDSPSTTSATTYKLQIATALNTYQVGVIDSASSAGSIILMEIGA